jgi:hypothetical protein
MSFNKNTGLQKQHLASSDATNPTGFDMPTPPT